MSNNPFDRTILRPLEKPLSQDIDQAETNYDQAFRFVLAALFSDPDSGGSFDGFLGTGLLATAQSVPDMSVNVEAGIGFQDQASTEIAIDGVVGLNDLVTYKPIPLNAQQLFTVPAAPSAPNTRIDIIEVRADRIVTDPSLRRVFNTGLGQFEPGTVNKTLAWALDGRAATILSPALSTAPLSYVQGVAANPGVVPATTPGYIKIAEIAVGSDVTSIATADITDLRSVLTERLVRIHWPAQDGFNGTGTTTKIAGGAVRIASGGVWYLEIGDGIEAGDIIEDIIVVVNKLNATAMNIDTKVELTLVDLDAETAVGSALNYDSVSAPTAKVWTTSALAASGGGAFFPHIWSAGTTGTIIVEANGASIDCLCAYAIVRRASIKRDS